MKMIMLGAAVAAINFAIFATSATGPAFRLLLERPTVSDARKLLTAVEALKD